MPERQVPETFLVAFSLAGEQRDLVRAIAEAVEKELGKDTVFLDEWFEFYVAGNNADLKLQSIYGERSKLVVVCVSKPYGEKPWTRMENEAIRARHMKSYASPDHRDRDAILPIRVGDGDIEGSPFNSIAPDIRSKTVDQAASLIIQRLRHVVPNLAAVSTDIPANYSWPETPSTLSWPIADHVAVREAFAALLAPTPAWRTLSVCGPSDTGKSHITKQMLFNALQMPELACGRFDFKGGTDMDGEVRAFVQNLDIPPPPPSAPLNERLGRVLDAVLDRKRPTLFIFDTYEAAPESQQDWVEKELLVRLIRATWLRVVIAGQRVPESVGAIWGPMARMLEVKPPPPAEWFAFGRQYKPDLTQDFVEEACRYAKNKSSLLAQLFGPAT